MWGRESPGERGEGEEGRGGRPVLAAALVGRAAVAGARLGWGGVSLFVTEKGEEKEIGREKRETH